MLHLYLDTDKDPVAPLLFKVLTQQPTIEAYRVVYPYTNRVITLKQNFLSKKEMQHVFAVICIFCLEHKKCCRKSA